MYRKIRKFYKYFIHIRKTDNHAKLARQMDANIQALHSLNNLMDDDFNKYIPFTDYALSPYTIAHVLNDLTINSRKNIVEFGSGASTIYFSLFLQRHNFGQSFVSFDQDEGWLETLKSNYLNDISLGEDQTLKLVYAPLQFTKYGKVDEAKWYLEATVNESIEGKVDCIIVDGPTGVTNKFARYPVINFIVNNLSDDGVVFVDDANREDEQELINELIENYNFKKSSTLCHSVLSKKPSFYTQPIGDYLS